MDETTPASARHDGPDAATPDTDAAPGPDGPSGGRAAGRGFGTSSVRPVDLRDYVEPVRGQATCRRVFASTQLAVDVWCIEPRQVTGPLHLPERDVSYTVIAGRSWFVTDDGEVGLDPLGAILIPADVVHGFENRAPDPLIVLATSAPPGEIPEDPPVATDAVAVTFERSKGRLRGAVESLLGTRPPDSR